MSTARRLSPSPRTADDATKDELARRAQAAGARPFPGLDAWFADARLDVEDLDDFTDRLGRLREERRARGSR